jgi:flagellar FliL protein
MAKTDAAKLDDGDESAAGGSSAESKKRFGKKFLLIAGGGALALVLAAVAGVYFFFFSDSQSASTRTASATGAPIAAPQVAYYDVPDIVVNIQSADGTPAYLKLSVALELDSADEKPAIQALMPRVVDQFQGYLRELRIDDLHGSAGVVRLKEELLRRITVAAAPFPVRDVLLKEMIIQ